MPRPNDLMPDGDASEYLRTVDAVGRRIRDPVQKLRFLRGSLAPPEARAEAPAPADPAGEAPPRQGIGRALVTLSGAGAGCMAALALVLGPLARDGGDSRSPGTSSAGSPPAAVTTLAGDPPAAVAPVAFLVERPPACEEEPLACEAAEDPERRPAPDPEPSAVSLATVEQPPPGPFAALEWQGATGSALPLATASLALPVPDLPAPIGLRPAAVWLVESGEGWEQYSNGLRIETALAVEGERRRYRVFTEGAGMTEEVFDRPVGILFHTTESHVWPLEAAYNENLRDSSQNLLGHVARDRLYHYVIDRFGRAFRIVQDEAKANHAGHGVWQSGERIYLNLNHAFFGVSFETRWAGGRELPLTEAQITAGRNLTAWLRERWDIAADMCVTHGLTSVSPRNHLIGYHVDWARGFPFAAFDLPDQYRRIAPSVLTFGFGHDARFLAAVGEPWSGVREAEQALAAEAARMGRPLGDLRRERRALFDRWLREQSRADDASERAAAAPTTPGGS